jgi:hypothetical protein
MCAFGNAAIILRKTAGINAAENAATKRTQEGVESKGLSIFRSGGGFNLKSEVGKGGNAGDEGASG